MNSDIRVLFMGTPEFAVPTLQKLIDEKYNICGVFTQPDKPKGRGYKLMPPPVKELALKYNIPVFQPLKMKEATTLDIIHELSPDVIIVVAYGKLLPKTILDYPKLGCINVHASLLPKYRGAGPIQWSVINGEEYTGVTTMYMAEGLDTGDMILKSQTPISLDETAGELHDRLSVLGADLLIETLARIQEGNAPRIVQSDEGTCYAPMLDKSLCSIDFTKTAKEVHHLIMGLSPWPVATTVVDGKTLKVHKSKLRENLHGECGKVISDQEFIVACKEGAVEFVTVQYEGGKKMPASDFLRGHPVKGKKL